MNRVVHFEIAAKDPAKMAKFYTDTFEWKIEKWPGPIEYWLAETGEEGSIGINGALMSANDAVGPVVNTIGVEDLDAMMEKVKSNGGTIRTPKVAIPTVGWFCYAVDPEGAPFGMMQPDTDAK
jgi:predicted enzyme related to lactoylglutathione lyase